MSVHVESKLNEIRKGLDQIKTKLEKEDYKFIEELKRIQFEIDQIKKRMEEKKKKAMDPNLSPQEKLAILEEIKEDSKLLEQKIKEHQQYSNKYRFDVSKHVSSLVEAMKKAIEGRGGNSRSPRSGGSGSGGNHRNPTNPNDPLGDPNN
jgi:DNA repair exonuclease SbcCD ATPase subunit